MVACAISHWHQAAKECISETHSLNRCSICWLLQYCLIRSRFLHLQSHSLSKINYPACIVSRTVQDTWFCLAMYHEISINYFTLHSFKVSKINVSSLQCLVVWGVSMVLFRGRANKISLAILNLIMVYDWFLCCYVIWCKKLSNKWTCAIFPNSQIVFKGVCYQNVTCIMATWFLH